MILIADAEIDVFAEGVLESYIDYIENYPEYELIHPSNFSGPKETHEEKERQRLVDDWADLIRQWRDGFIRNLIEDHRSET